MKLINIIKKRPYIILTIITIILGLLNYNKDIDKYSDFSIELLKGLPVVIILMETQKRKYFLFVGYFCIIISLILNFIILVSLQNNI